MVSIYPPSFPVADDYISSKSSSSSSHPLRLLTTIFSSSLLSAIALRSSLSCVFRHLLPQLARLRERDEPVLDVSRALLLDEADASKAVGRFRVQNLVEDALAGFLLLLSV